MINVCCWRDKVCSSMDKWEHIDHFILFAISKFNIPLESISEIESIFFFFVCVPACSLFSRSKIHFWLITNAPGSWRANVFVECQLMLSDKCLKLSQGSCPSFRLCQMSPLVEADNSYTGGDRAVCSRKGLTLPYGATVRWKKKTKNTANVLIETLKVLTLCTFPLSSMQMVFAFLHRFSSHGYLATLASSAGFAGHHSKPFFDNLRVCQETSDKVFLQGAQRGEKPCQPKK